MIEVGFFVFSGTDSSDGGTVTEFDFLINGEFVYGTLEKHIEARGLSTVRKQLSANCSS